LRFDEPIQIIDIEQQALTKANVGDFARPNKFSNLPRGGSEICGGALNVQKARRGAHL